MFYLFRRGQGGGLSGITREGEECGTSYTEVEYGEREGRMEELWGCETQ